jgi:hypothetical protein
VARSSRVFPTVVHLKIRSAAVIGHHRQAQTRRSAGFCDGFLVQSVRATKPPGQPEHRAHVLPVVSGL